jgi:hypothetical protein
MLQGGFVLVERALEPKSSGLQTMDLADSEEAKRVLLSGAPLYAWQDLELDSTLPPRRAGVYAWFFTHPPDRVPISDCIARDGAYLLYVGIASDKRKGLYSRVREHFTLNAEGSTLRKSLGCLLEEKLGTVLVRAGSRRTFGPQELALTAWMQAHARVAWFPIESPERIERRLIDSLRPPLNLNQNETHPFHKTLTEIRRRAHRRADAAAARPTK